MHNTGFEQIICAKCGEPTTSGSSWRGIVHRYGPTTHAFKPAFVTARGDVLLPNRSFRINSDQSITITREGVTAWKASWPASGLPNKPVTFMYFQGDLVDILPSHWRDFDGAALNYLSIDAQFILDVYRNIQDYNRKADL
jgi:hypothetical protein